MSVEGGEAVERPRRKYYGFHVRLKAPVYNAVMKIVDSGAYMSPSKYVEDLVLRDLERLGMKPIKDYKSMEAEEVVKSVDKSGVVSIRMPKAVLGIIEALTRRSYFLTPSDYVRYAVMRDLEARGFIQGLVKGEVEAGPSESRRPSEAIMVSTLVPAAIIDEMDKLIESGLYLRVSDYLMDLIIRDLDKLKQEV